MLYIYIYKSPDPVTVDRQIQGKNVSCLHLILRGFIHLDLLFIHVHMYSSVDMKFISLWMKEIN